MIWYVHELLSGRFASICFIHNPIFCRFLYDSLNIFHNTGTCGRINLNIIWLIILDLNILDRFEVDFQVKIVKSGGITCTFCCVQYSPEHAWMKLTHFIYLQLIIRWQIKHFTVIYGLQITIFDSKIEYFRFDKISLSGIPISLPNIADLPIWAQEKITCMDKELIQFTRCMGSLCKHWLILDDNITTTEGF